MGTTNRAAVLTKAHKVLKQHYKPVQPERDRPLMQQMLYACCLENAPFEVADKVYALLEQSFIDWNEVRVSTIGELADVMKALPNPQSAASNLKRVLHSVFESIYSFDLEALKKKTITDGVKRLEKIEGSNPFIISYVVQAALGGHAIPLDRGALDVLWLMGAISDAEAASGNVSGLERVIQKNKGVEFGSLLHQLGADWVANPNSTEVRKTIQSISADAKERFGGPLPGRVEPAEVAKPAAPAAKPADEKAAPAKASKKGEEKPAEKPAEKAAKGAKPAAKPADKHAAEKHATDKHAADKHDKHAVDKHADKSHAEKPAKSAAKHDGEKHSDKHPAEKHAAKSSSAKHDAADKHAADKHGAGDRHGKSSGKAAGGKRPVKASGDKKKSAGRSKEPAPAKKKSATKQLTKRKPR